MNELIDRNCEIADQSYELVDRKSELVDRNCELVVPKREKVALTNLQASLKCNPQPHWIKIMAFDLTLPKVDAPLDAAVMCAGHLTLGDGAFRQVGSKPGAAGEHAALNFAEAVQQRVVVGDSLFHELFE